MVSGGVFGEVVASFWLFPHDIISVASNDINIILDRYEIVMNLSFLLNAN
jgi:hypothetical protein